MKSDLQEKEKQLTQKITMTQGMEKRIESSNKVIRQLQEREDHWHLKYSQTELQLREREEHLHQLQNELLERDDNEGTVRQRLMVAEQQLSVQQQNIQTLQMQLSESDKRFKEYNETSSELKDTISSLEEEKEQMAVQMSTKDQEIPKVRNVFIHSISEGRYINKSNEVEKFFKMCPVIWEFTLKAIYTIIKYLTGNSMSAE